MKDNEHIYLLLCVKCPYCKEIVDAEVIEKDNIKKIICPSCKASAEYKIE